MFEDDFIYYESKPIFEDLEEIDKKESLRRIQELSDLINKLRREKTVKNQVIIE